MSAQIRADRPLDPEPDEDFAFFLEKFGPAIERRDVPASSIRHWQGTLPDQLLTYWQAYGWCGYAKGIFWTVDPAEYEPVVAAWLADTSYAQDDTYHVIARSAFGKVYFWGERTGPTLHIWGPDSLAMPSNQRWSDLDEAFRIFFGVHDTGANDFSDAQGKQLFARALKKLGRLAHDEMYGFVPALALGGPPTLDHLQKVKAVEHLVFLSQLTELRESRLLML